MTSKKQKHQMLKNQKENENKQLKEQLARALADYDNLKKRMEDEKRNLYKLASMSVFLKLLPILDNLRSALKHVADSGIAIIVGELETLLKEEGLEEIKLKSGDVFDENLAEVVEVVEIENKKLENTISEVLLSGWQYSDNTVVRHAKVKVYSCDTNTRIHANDTNNANR